MERSSRFAALARRKRILVGGHELFVSRGDALGAVEELYLDALVRGAAPGSQDAEARALYDELDEDLKRMVDERLRRR
jgi:hypothetical protein